MRIQVFKRLTLASFAMAIALAGCASGGGGGGGGGGGSPTRLTLQDLEPVIQLDAYQAVQRLRSRWLQARGAVYANVFVDGAERPGGLDVLRQLRVADIQEMRYLNAGDATTRYGTGHEGGVILVTTRR